MDLFQSPRTLIVLALLVPGAAALEIWAAARRRRLLSALGHPPTLARLYPPQALGRRRLRFVTEVAAAAAIVAALAGPQWGVEMVSGVASGLQVVVALDTSLSMLAEDVGPSRLDKAKSELTQILDGLKGDRIGLVSFAGEAHVQCPLTTDAEALRGFVEGIRVGTIPQPGSNLGAAIALGIRTLARYPGHKALILLTDGEDTKGRPAEAAKGADEAGVHLFVVGVGTPEGAPIPVKDPQGRTQAYKKDSRGATVVSRLGEAEMIRVAAAGRGAYYRVTPDETEALEIVRLVSELEKSKVKSASMSRYKNRYRLPLALGLLILLLGMLICEEPVALRDLFRRAPAETPAAIRPFTPTQPPRAGEGSVRGMLAAMLLALLSSGCARLKSDADLWRGNRSYRAGDFAGALDRYLAARRGRPGSEKPVFNSGNARYKLGDLDAAREAFASVAESDRTPARVVPRAHYNLGNAHFRKGGYREAAESYKRCLLADSSDEDCRFNLAKALERLKHPPPKQGSQPPPPQKPQTGSGGGGDKDRAKTRPQSGLSPEDAERVLRAVREREKGTTRPQPAWQKRRPPPPETEADW